MKAKPDPADIHVGSRLKMRRTLLGLSQEKLGEAVGLTFQQIQKYERGANRIGASRLYQFSRILNVPVSYFFEDMPEIPGDKTPGLAHPPQEAYEGEEQMGRRETLELVRAYYRILDPTVRKRILEMIKALGSSGDNDN